MSEREDWTMRNRTTATLDVDGELIEFPPDYQGVTLWLGDGLPVHIGDEQAPVDICDLVSTHLQRAVVAARLEAIAEVLRSGAIYDSLGRAQVSEPTP